MAGDWLKFDKNTPDKPEVFEIAAELQIDPDAVVGKLMRVWSWFDSHTEDGNAARVTPALLDRCAGMDGFVTVMQSVGWMVIENGGCRLPKFERHCGETAKKRALGKNRTQKSRSSNADNFAQSVTGGVTEALLEKRREEKKKEKENASPDEPAASPSSKRKTAITIVAWLDSLGDDLAVPPEDPVFRYAEKVGIPADFLRLAWDVFRDQMRDRGKLQKDWRQTFRNYVERNFLKLWWINTDGAYQLTTVGLQAQRKAA